MVKCGEMPLEGEGRKNPLRLSMLDGPTETVEYMWANIRWMHLTIQLL